MADDDKKLRTSSGNPTKHAREKYGIGDSGKFPVFDHKSCVSAVDLRHHGSGISASRVLSHVMSWARRNDDSACLKKAKKAKEKDKED